MNTLSKLHKSLATATAGIVLAAGFASSALSASPPFTVTPGGIGEPQAPFVANQIQGTSSELLTLTAGPNTFTGSGWVNFSGFVDNGNLINGGVSGLNNTYNLYLTFSLAGVLASGPFGQAGSNYNLTSLTFQLLADVGTNTTFTQADASSSTAATVGGVTGDDIILGNGSLLVGVAGFDALFGAFLNSTQTYANTAAGNAFFTNPVPFYNIAFDAFNNTSQGVEVNGNLISITNAAGIVDFNAVPEPESLGLLGIGLLGLVAGLRRRKAKVVA